MDEQRRRSEKRQDYYIRVLEYSKRVPGSHSNFRGLISELYETPAACSWATSVPLQPRAGPLFCMIKRRVQNMCTAPAIHFLPLFPPPFLFRPGGEQQHTPHASRLLSPFS